MPVKLDNKPTITLGQISRELQLINENVFKLKQFSRSIIERIEKGDIQGCRAVIDVYKPNEIIKNLELYSK